MLILLKNNNQKKILILSSHVNTKGIPVWYKVEKSVCFGRVGIKGFYGNITPNRNTWEFSHYSDSIESVKEHYALYTIQFNERLKQKK